MSACCASHHYEGCTDGYPGCCGACPVNPRPDRTCEFMAAEWHRGCAKTARGRALTPSALVGRWLWCCGTHLNVAARRGWEVER